MSRAERPHDLAGWGRDVSVDRVVLTGAYDRESGARAGFDVPSANVPEVRDWLSRTPLSTRTDVCKPPVEVQRQSNRLEPPLLFDPASS